MPSRQNATATRQVTRAVNRAAYPPVGIFISYSSENASLARKLKDKLEGLEDDIKLDVFISAELGGVKWKSYLLDKLAKAKILILCYTSTSMKLDWCSYELGRFHAQGNNHTICLINKNLDKPPDTISDWQAYPADRGGLQRFFIDFFQKGLFTDKVAINTRLAESNFAKRLTDAVIDLEGEFAAYRVDEHFFPYRITIASPNEGHLPSKLDFATASVTGDQRALDIFGVNSGIKWPAFKAACRKSHSAKWPEELERAASETEGHLIPQSLSAFTTPKRGSFVPAISRIESFEDKKPWRMSLIFVETSAPGEAPRNTLDTRTMPDKWARMLSFLTVGLRLRWNDLEPAEGELRRALHPGYRGNWKEVVKGLFDGIVYAEEEMKRTGVDNYGKFFDLFDPDLAKRMTTGTQPYYDALHAMRASLEHDDAAKALEAIGVVKRVNSTFTIATLAQFQRYIEKLDNHA